VEQDTKYEFCNKKISTVKDKYYGVNRIRDFQTPAKDQL